MRTIGLSWKNGMVWNCRITRVARELKGSSNEGSLATLTALSQREGLSKILVAKQKTLRFPAALGLVLLSTLGSSQAQTGVVAWGDNSFGRAMCPRCLRGGATSSLRRALRTWLHSVTMARPLLGGIISVNSATWHHSRTAGRTSRSERADGAISSGPAGDSSSVRARHVAAMD